MFSRLEPLLRPVTRRTESTDTRLAIRRDESKDFGRSKGGHHEDEYTPVPWEDLASVSTASLRAFLQSLVGDQTGVVTQIAEDRHTPTTLGSRATQAYQTMGRAVHDPNVIGEPVTADRIASSADPDLSHQFDDQEVLQVRNFIADLIELERRNVHELTIQRSLTFLDSVRLGIAEAQTSAIPA